MEKASKIAKTAFGATEKGIKLYENKKVKKLEEQLKWTRVRDYQAIVRK